MVACGESENRAPFERARDKIPDLEFQ